MSDRIICGECARSYDPGEIGASLNGEVVATLAELRPRQPVENGNASPSFLSRAFTGRSRHHERIRRQEETKKEMNRDRFDDLRAYTFRCPEEHLVDGNPGEPLGIAVLGGSGASKSHWLAAIIEEMDHLSVLRKVGVRLSNALYTDPQLAQNVSEVYERERQLPNTDPGKMVGPYGAKLTIGRGPADPEAKRYAMQLFDIAGEDLDRISKIAENARFIAMCKGLVILLDPVEFIPTQFDKEPLSERVRLRGGRVIKNGIRAIADTFAELYGASSPRELEIPICFVLAKADAIQWTGEFDWRGQTEAVIRSAEEGGDVGEALRTSSIRTCEAFERLGGELVIAEIEESFDPLFVRWAAASATSTMPALGQGTGDSDWLDPPVPQGVALSVLQVLDAAGLVPQAPVVDAG